MRTVLFSTLYPSAVRPQHGIFVEARLRHLVDHGAVESRVVAPVPWFPSTNNRFGEYAQFAATPRIENRNGMMVTHPRYFLPPKIGMSIAPLLLAFGAVGELRRLVRNGYDFDLIDAHYYYPDGVAAVILGRWLNKPVLITSRGSDINVLSDFALPRRWMRWAQTKVSASVFVSQDLKSKMAEICGADHKFHVIRNGVDLDRFRPVDKLAAKGELGLDGGRHWIVFVGRVTRAKGAFFAIRALAELPDDVRLAIVGVGEDMKVLRLVAAELGVTDRVRFAGARPQRELPTWYSAASALILPSESEGIPNVVLESIACGTPVVATAVGGIPEVMTTDIVGKMVRDTSAPALAAAVLEVLNAEHDPCAVREQARRFRWEETTKLQMELFQQILQRDLKDEKCAM